MMKRTLAGLIGGVVFGLMISGSAFASGGDEAYEHGGYGYGGGYMYNDDAYEYGRARMIVPPPVYGNVVPTAPATVYPPANVSYGAPVPYYGREAYEYSGRYGYGDDSYEYRGGYWGHR
ncbi:hypothetical protein [Candidatus Electronema sp. JM]|uniref:hypothetical protein n=1 Tax=Candidatus Electronema sp. JM TaxID=3401571 RepID=UPI003AA93CB2